MKKWMKWVGAAILTLWGVAGSAASIWAIWDKLSNATASFWCSIGAALTTPVIWWLSGAIVLILFLLQKTAANMRARGDITFLTLARRLNPLIYCRVIVQLHLLQHIHDALIRRIDDHPNRGVTLFRDATFSELLSAFLKKAKHILDLCTGGDVAVHIKLFEHVTTQNASVIDLPDAVLQTALRVPSDREFNLRSADDPLPARSHTEEFRIIHGTDGSAQEMLKKETEYEDAERAVNSGYNYVFGETEHFFLCNNLRKAVKKKKFFSTSRNYEKYYNALAVFLVNAHVEPRMPIDPKPVFGILAVDSIKPHVMELTTTRSVAGYMAHRLNNVFSHLTR